MINQNPELLQTWGDIGSAVGHFAFVPGILGLVTLKAAPKTASLAGLRIAGKTLAILHIVINALLLGLYALLFIGVVFLGVTH